MNETNIKELPLHVYTKMNQAERLQLKSMIEQSDCENNTDEIRKLKHSVTIRDEIRKLELLKRSNTEMRACRFSEFEALCQTECYFLYNQYTDIFNKVIKDELDLDIMTKVLLVLKLIEDEKLDQHEGSVMVGKLLKELYVDSALRRAENLDKENAEQVVEPVTGKEISWKQFSKTMKM